MAQNIFWIISSLANTAILFLFTFMSIKFSQLTRVRTEQFKDHLDNTDFDCETTEEEEVQSYLRQRSHQGSEGEQNNVQIEILAALTAVPPHVPTESYKDSNLKSSPEFTEDYNASQKFIGTLEDDPDKQSYLSKNDDY